MHHLVRVTKVCLLNKETKQLSFLFLTKTLLKESSKKNIETQVEETKHHELQTKITELECSRTIKKKKKAVRRMMGSSMTAGAKKMFGLSTEPRESSHIQQAFPLPDSLFCFVFCSLCTDPTAAAAAVRPLVAMPTGTNKRPNTHS